MARWNRPYPAGAGTVLAGLIFWMGSVPLLIIGAVSLGLLYNRDFTPKVGYAVVPAAAVWMTYFWRMFRTGVFVSNDALRVRTLFRTWTLPWQDIGSFIVRPSRWGFGDSLWVVRKHGQAVETPIRLRPQLGLQASFLIRPNAGQTYLWPADLELTLQALNRRIGR